MYAHSDDDDDHDDDDHDDGDEDDDVAEAKSFISARATL